MKSQSTNVRTYRILKPMFSLHQSQFMSKLSHWSHNEQSRLSFNDPYFVKFSVCNVEFEELRTTCRIFEEQFSFLFLVTLTIVSLFMIVGPSYTTVSWESVLSPLSKTIHKIVYFIYLTSKLIRVILATIKRAKRIFDMVYVKFFFSHLCYT